MSRFDERDVIFSRLLYKKDSEVYNDYYSSRPDKLNIDDKIRSLPPMGDSSANMYNPLLSPLPDACFDFLGDIKQFSEGTPSPDKVEADSKQFTELLLGLARYYGAVSCGVALLKDEHYYSHKGRPLSEYGKEIIPSYKYGIVFAVEMDEKIIDTAPNVTESIAVTKGYVDAAIIGMILSYYIRKLGYEAKNNMDGDYLFPLPPVAEAAGLGEMGLSGLLVTKEFGPRIRLAMVSTNIPLVPNEVSNLGIRDFCRLCERCKQYCPSKAIDNHRIGNEHNFSDTSCIQMWQKFGSDCGICLSACPFSHRLPHEIVADLTTDEKRHALADYCDIHFTKRNYTTKYPEWMQAAYKK